MLRETFSVEPNFEHLYLEYKKWSALDLSQMGPGLEKL